jgi:hypothetical protein
MAERPDKQRRKAALDQWRARQRAGAFMLTHLCGSAQPGVAFTP